MEKAVNPNYVGGFAQCRSNIEELLEFADLAIRRGNVYQMDWPGYYQRDVKFLLNVIDELQEAMNECKKSQSSAKRAESLVRAGLDQLADEVLSGDPEKIRAGSGQSRESAKGCDCGSGYRIGG